ncbi:MAG: hypothetical protein ACFCD0_02495 [Gemmataceae bacterium]
MFEAIISNINTGRVHRWLLETRESARRYADDWLEMKRDQAERRAFSRGTFSKFSGRDYRVEIEYVEPSEQLLAISAAIEETAGDTKRVAAAA